jgi:4-amino-4-deoxy-L-arabinose transferase-like glycosyltransferase
MIRQKKILVAGLILALVVLGLLTRLPGLKWGLPYFYHVDERGFGKFTIFYFTGDLNPHFFEVPSLYTYMTAAVWSGYYLGGKITGRFQNASDFFKAYYRDPTVFVVLGRLLSALLAVATVVLVFVIGRKMYGLRAGALAGLMLVFSLEHVKQSHCFIPDVTMVFFLTLSFFFIWSIYTTGKASAYILAGLCAGLAYATKYGGHYMALPLLLAHVFRASENKEPFLRSLFSPKLLGAFLSFCGGFLIGCPYAVLDSRKFIQDFRRQTEHLFSTGHLGSSTAEPAWLFYLKYGFRDNIGRWAQFLIPGGIIYALAKHRRKDWLLLSVPLTMFPLTGIMKIYATRYLMPLVVFFVLLAALFLDELLTWISAGLKKIKKPAIPSWLITSLMAVVVLGFLLPSVVQVARYDDSITRTETRSMAKSWVEANIPKGERLAIESYAPALNPKDYRYIYKNTMGEEELDWYAVRLVKYAIISDIMYLRFTQSPREFPQEAAFYRSLDEKAFLLKTYAPRWDEDLTDLHNPTIKIYGLSRLPNDSFPGAYRRFTQSVRIAADASGRWIVRTAVGGAEPRSSEEKPGPAYIRFAAADGRELWKASLTAESLPSDRDFRLQADLSCAPLTEPFNIFIGYESTLKPGLLSEVMTASLNKETLLAGPVDPAAVRARGFEGRFFYGEFPNTRGDLFFQSAVLVREESGWSLSGTAFGSRLRWGPCYALNPFIKITDPNGRELSRLILSPGKVGGLDTATRAPVSAQTAIPALPERFRVFIGYDSFFSQNQPQDAGGPEEVEIRPGVEDD